jgi:hypothetical protein
LIRFQGAALDVGLVFYSEEALQQVRDAVARDTAGDVFVGIGADIPFQSTDCWCPGEATDPIFGDRRDAEELIHAAVLNRNGLNGQNVNVVIIDRGPDPAHITITRRWSFGTATPIPVPSPANHTMMVARHIQRQRRRR